MMKKEKVQLLHAIRISKCLFAGHVTSYPGIDTIVECRCHYLAKERSVKLATAD